MIQTLSLEGYHISLNFDELETIGRNILRAIT